MAECRQQGGWIQFDEAGELQHRSSRSLVERNATWQMMQLSCPSPPTHLINTHSINSTTTRATPDHQSAAAIRAMDQKQLIKTTHDLNFFFSPCRENCNGFNYLNTSVGTEDSGCGGESDQTLQLFPLRSGDGGTGNNSDKGTDVSVAEAMDANLNPCQFFEFLPLKN